MPGKMVVAVSSNSPSENLSADKFRPGEIAIIASGSGTGEAVCFCAGNGNPALVYLRSGCGGSWDYVNSPVRTYRRLWPGETVTITGE